MRGALLKSFRNEIDFNIKKITYCYLGDKYIYI